MFCAKCGKQIEDNSRFCPFCGQRTDAPVENTAGTSRQGKVFERPEGFSVAEKALAFLGAQNKKLLGGIALALAAGVVAFGASRLVGGVIGGGGGKTLPEKSIDRSAEEHTATPKEAFAGIFGGSKTLPEKMLAMPVEEYVAMSPEDFIEMLDEEEVSYSLEGDYYVKMLDTDSFLNYDCLYSYEPDFLVSVGGSWPERWNADGFRLFTAFKTEDEMKKGQKAIDQYLEKMLVAKSKVLKSECELYDSDGSGSEGEWMDEAIYLTDCSEEGVEDYWERLGQILKDSYDPNDLRQITLRTDFGVKYSINEDAFWNKDAFWNEVRSKDYKLYKFISVFYLPTRLLRNYIINGYEAYEKFKSNSEYICCIQIHYAPMTENEYFDFAGNRGYDVKFDHAIDAEEIEKNSRYEEIFNSYMDMMYDSDWKSQYSGREDALRYMKSTLCYPLHMSEEHDWNTWSGAEFKDKEEKRACYIARYGWDTEADAPIDLSGYRNSGAIYCAVELNYNYLTGKYFESEEEKRAYLEERNYNYEAPVPAASEGSKDESEAEEAAGVDWKEAYRNALQTADLDELESYLLKDINGDGIPEMFTDEDVEYDYGRLFYILKDGSVENILANSYEANKVAWKAMYPGGTIASYIYQYNSDTGGYELLLEAYDEEESGYGYAVNEQSCSEAEYNAQLASVWNEEEALYVWDEMQSVSSKPLLDAIEEY